MSNVIERQTLTEDHREKMPDYISVAKPTGAGYTSVSKPGGTTIRAGMKLLMQAMPLTISRPQVTGNAWTKLAKPYIAGYDIPWSEMLSAWSDATLTWEPNQPYTNVSKPT